jgi:hypothetical protein
MYMELENFQDIIDFPNYMINENGDIYSKYKKKLLKPRLTKPGYIALILRKNKKSIHKTIHRLLGLQYLPNPDNKPCIDHKNRNRVDNSLTNLRWVSYNENAKNKASKQNSTSRFIGVRKTLNKKKPYRVETTYQGKKYHIGYYEIEEEAYEAYKKFNLDNFNIEILEIA